MKKHYSFLFAASLFCIPSIFGQGMASGFIDKNQVKGHIYPKNGLFYNYSGSSMSAGYEVPVGSGMHTLDYLSLSFGGIRNSDGNVLMNDFVFQDFFNEASVNSTGPLTIDGNATSTLAVQNAYDKVFKVERSDIEMFITAFAAGDVTSGAYTVPASIMDWPGSGPAGYSQQLAPYHDYNNNGVYDPMNGDYPIIKGEQAVYMILNTQGIPATYTMKCEYHVMVYVCEKTPSVPNDEIYDQTVFIHYKIINRTSESYSDMYAGNYISYSIYKGSHVTPMDYTGSFPSASAVYAFNTSLITAPVQSINYLKGPIGADGEPLKMTSYILPYSAVASDPLNVIKNYYLLQGRFEDGRPMINQGNGYPTDSLPDSTTTFIYPGIFDPDHIGTNGLNPGFNWSETQLFPGPIVSNTPNYRTGISGCGPFELPAFGEAELEIALISTFNNALSPYNKVLQNYTENQLLNELYETGNLSCTTPFDPLMGTEELYTHGFTIYPNPAEDHIMLQFVNDMEGATYRILQVSGQQIAAGTVGTGAIDVSGLAQGVYFIEVIKDNQRTGCVKWIKR